MPPLSYVVLQVCLPVCAAKGSAIRRSIFSFKPGNQNKLLFSDFLVWTFRIVEFREIQKQLKYTLQFVKTIILIFWVAASQLSTTHFYTYERKKYSSKSNFSSKSNLLFFIKIKLWLNKICRKKIWNTQIIGRLHTTVLQVFFFFTITDV